MKPMKILIIEDDFIIANVLKKELEKYEYDITLVEDFTKVMETFQKIEPHLVLLDINLPHHNGYYWCSQIRAHSNVPIIFISSLSDKMDQMMAIQMDRQKAAISYQNKKTSLTYTELQILSCLFEHGEEYAKREEILDYC